MTDLNSKYLIPVVVIIVLTILVGGGYYFYQTQKEQTQINSQVDAKEETKNLIAKVGSLIELPTGEDPTVATVTDTTKLQEQSFFQKAKNGDKVLIYTGAKKAILYDPIANKIIDVAPINIGSVSAATSSDSSQQTEAKTVLLNGTKTVGLTTRIEPQIKKVSELIKVVKKDNAQSLGYEKTLIVMINSSAKELADSLANSLKATVSSLPAGEIKPEDADLLIILGKDRI